MDIELIRKMKEDLNENITSLIRVFELQTGVVVDSVDLLRCFAGTLAATKVELKL